LGASKSIALKPWEFVDQRIIVGSAKIKKPGAVNQLMQCEKEAIIIIDKKREKNLT